MSEASSFCTGSCGSGNLTLNPVHPPFPSRESLQHLFWTKLKALTRQNATEAASASAAMASSMSAFPTPTPTTTPSYVRTTPTPGVRNVNLPPYVVNNMQGALAARAIFPNATHADGTLEYEMHNLWGHGILKATYDALSAVFPGVRPFIIGRSSFSGSGSVGGHWGGDNYSKWSYMFYSIPQALPMSFFGIPMFGADACGFPETRIWSFAAAGCN